MPNIKSAKKRVLITKKETVLNNDVKASMKTAIKKVEKAQTKEEAQIKLNNQFRDLNIKLLDCGQTSIIEINRRPS